MKEINYLTKCFTCTSLLAMTPAMCLFGQDKLVRDAVRVESPPAIDGIIEDVWSQSDWVSIDYLAPDPWVTPETLFAAEYKMLFDFESIYILVKVVDDIVAVYTTGNSAWSDDAVELFFDMANDGGSYDSFTTQVYFRAVDDDQFYYQQIGATPVDSSQIDREMTETDDGYIVEFRVNWSMWGVDAFELTEIGFDIFVNDGDVKNDWAPARLIWNNKEGDNNESAENFGVVNLIFEPEVNNYGPYDIVDSDGSGWIKSDEMNWLLVDFAPWLYSASTSSWIFGPESALEAAGGTWLYITRGQNGGQLAEGDEAAYGPYKIILSDQEVWIETNELGWLWLNQNSSWCFSSSLSHWVHAPESAFTNGGLWAFFP